MKIPGSPEIQFLPRTALVTPVTEVRMAKACEDQQRDVAGVKTLSTYKLIKFA